MLQRGSRLFKSSACFFALFLPLFCSWTTTVAALPEAEQVVAHDFHFVDLPNIDAFKHLIDTLTNRTALVWFYAPWGGHCKRLQPAFNEAAAHFRNDSRIVFARVIGVSPPDPVSTREFVENEVHMNGEFGSVGFPKLVVYTPQQLANQDRVRDRYRGVNELHRQRTSASIIEAMNKVLADNE